jgi:hypothetical protein
VQVCMCPCVCACVRASACCLYVLYVRMSAYLPAGQISKQTN